MESATLRKWLAEQGCTFEQHARAKGGEGLPSVVARRGKRRARLPLVGSRKRLAPETVKKICEELGVPAPPRLEA